jgi:acyl-CoA thioesterase FadM
MTGWSETYRGTVPPWECDLTEHFTIAYYFDRLDQAGAAIAAELGLAEAWGGGVGPRRFDLRFARELRAGAAFHIESAPIGAAEGLRLGHRVVDSATGETVTWVAEAWDRPLPSERRQAIAGRLAAWDGPAVERRPEPAAAARFFPTARGRVRPQDLDEQGRFAPAAHVHRFTDSLLQAAAALGMTAEYMHAARRGYSTFELRLRLIGELRLGDSYLVEIGVAHLGNSSLRFVHRLSDPRNGREIARLGQFGVLLDLDARRPASLPDDVRSRAKERLIPLEHLGSTAPG